MNIKSLKRIRFSNTGANLGVLLVHLFLILFAAVCLVPFLYVLSYSFTPYETYLKNPTALIPDAFTVQAYKDILSYKLFYSGYENTLFITVVGTCLNIVLLLLSAYPLSKKDLKGRNVILAMVLFTMLFNGGMIPRFTLVRNLGLIDSIWSLILPGAIGAYNLILMKNFISAIPESLEESAMIDGANEFLILGRIITPLCLPAIATFTIMCAVAHWNSFFDAVIFTNRRDSWPLMLVLREIVSEGNAGDVANMAYSPDDVATQSFTLQMAMIIASILPIVCVYPFLQKYFVTGLTMGGVKE